MKGLLVSVVCVVLISPFFQVHASQKNQLFEFTSVESAGLQDRQEVEETIETILDRPTTMTVDLIRVNSDLVSSLTPGVLQEGESTDLVLNESPVVVVSPSGRRMELNEFYVERNSPSGFYLSGSDAMNVTNSLAWGVVQDGAVFGNLHFGHEHYFVSPLEGDLHVLVRLDPSQFLDGAQPLDP
ncbi:MAG: hypothetical protein J4G15_10130 [Alphaproteobacteria bacterium]|nr:hypothetical protein [Alphaproteobacteria bacterium]